MKEFPPFFRPERKDKFSALNDDRSRCYLRRDIYEFMIARSSENEYFSLDEFKVRVKNSETFTKIIDSICKELETLGWNCKTSFGGTGLFIYSTDSPPPSCFEESEF